MFPPPLIGWIVAAAGTALALAGAFWAARRSAVSRSLVPARVTRVTGDGVARVEVAGSTGGSDAVLDRAVPGLIEGDTVMVRPRAGHPATYGPCPRPWNAYWLGLLCYGLVLIALGGTAALIQDTGDERPLFIPFIGVVLLLGPFLMAGKVAGLVGFARNATRTSGHIVGYRRHPHVRVNELPASMPRIEYTFGGATRRAWSRAAYMSSLFTGKRVAVWVGDRSPADIMTVGTLVYSTGVISLVCGYFGALFLVGVLLL
ncbi:hypothetical protein F4561_003061 [Lipingzhangella halophila]|uniref:DUF3592 domain-containing protein n=1 Tax=Lipingzhangella halophila TaxID=1783352 RepID=A0A7W7RHS7_9ACTN|nr:DUF3592 domain-containing protein [Lipingzhangella halophila]MBB4932241.1 hypothetical protein [Lipingzhangella halophila]